MLASKLQHSDGKFYFHEQKIESSKGFGKHQGRFQFLRNISNFCASLKTKNRVK